MSEYVIKRAATLREQVIEAILHDLQAGLISPGERITEEGLARRLSVSRTPIREALSQLSHQGTLQARAGRRYLVPFPTVAEIRDMIAVRKLLELPAIEMAAREFGREQIDAITQAIEGEAALTSSKSAVQFAKANEEFRETLFQAISNKALCRAITQFNTHLDLIRSSTLSQPAFRKQIVDWQRRLRDAIQDRDAALARTLWADYLDRAEQALVGAVENLSPKQAAASGRAGAGPQDRTRRTRATKEKSGTRKR
jgi:DNA-binding GntR family transcriptional regulator